MRTYFLCMACFFIGAWIGNPANANKAFKAGVWTRVHIFGLMPINESNDEKPHVE